MIMPVLAVDPGTMHLGWAVLSTSAHLEASGTWIPRRALPVLERHLWLMSKLQDLLALWQPALLAYEDFVWRTSDEGADRFVRGRPAMERLIGAIQALALWPPYPVLLPLLPQQWGAQLLGQRQHSKAQIAWAVNQRLGTTYTGDVYTNHESDAVGLGLVALDTYAHTLRMETRARVCAPRRR